jgi:hypothetical protein
MNASALTFKSGQVRAHSDGGWATIDQIVSGLTPKTAAAVVLSGWSIASDYQSDGQTSIYLWDNTANYWSTGVFTVSGSGQINVKFIGIYSDTRPFDITVNYVVISQ